MEAGFDGITTPNDDLRFLTALLRRVGPVASLTEGMTWEGIYSDV